MPTSDEGVDQNQERGGIKAGFETGFFLGVARIERMMSQKMVIMMRKLMVMMMNVYDKEKVYVMKLRCLVLLRC